MTDFHQIWIVLLVFLPLLWWRSERPLKQALQDPEHYWLGAFHLFDWNSLRLKHLISQLQRNPWQVQNLLQDMQNPELSLEFKMLTLQAAVRVEGQMPVEMLIAIAASRNVEWRLRVRSVVMLGFSEYGTEGLLRELKNFALRQDPEDLPEEMNNSALLALGHQIQFQAREVEGLGEQWFEELLRLSTLPHFSGTSVVIFAMANTRLPEAAEYLYLALEDPDPQRRFDAASVLFMFPGPRTRDHLRRAIALEDEPAIVKRLEISLEMIV